MSLESISTARHNAAALSDHHLDDQDRAPQGRHDAPREAPRQASTAFEAGPQPAPMAADAQRDLVMSRMHSDGAGPAMPTGDNGAPSQLATTAAPAHTQAPAQMPAALYNDQSIYLIERGADRSGALNLQQASINAQYAQALLPAHATSVQAFNSQDVAVLALATGVSPDAVRSLGVDAVAGYLNSAGNAAHQQDRLRSVLNIAHAAASQPAAPPQPSAHDMKQELRALLSMPNKAFKKMSDADIAAKYNEVMAALEAGGSYRIRFGKYNVSFTVDGNGRITESQCKRRGLFGGLFSAIGSFFGKFGKTLLAVCSFIPIPWISIPARIISGVIAVVDGIKAGNVLGAVAGAANAVVGGVGAIAGAATSAVASGVAKIAGTVRDAAHGAQAAIASFREGGVNGIVNGVLQAASTVSGAIGDVFDGVAEVAGDVKTWANRVLIGEQVVVDIKNGRIVEAVSNSAGLVGEVAGEFKGAEGVVRVTGQIQQASTHGEDAVGVVQALIRGDVQGAVGHGAGLAGGIDGAFGTGISAQFDAQTGWVGAASKWIGHGADAVGIVRQVASGQYDGAANASLAWIDSMQWDYALENIAGPAGLAPPQWDAAHAAASEAIATWNGFIAEGREMVSSVLSGDYRGALEQAIGLGNGVLGAIDPDAAALDADAGWARSIDRLLGHAQAASSATCAGATSAGHWTGLRPASPRLGSATAWRQARPGARSSPTWAPGAGSPATACGWPPPCRAATGKRRRMPRCRPAWVWAGTSTPRRPASAVSRQAGRHRSAPTAAA